MDNVLTFIALFIVVAVAISAGLGSLATVHSVNFGDCVKNSTGSWQNCSISNSYADQLSNTQAASSSIFGQLSYIEWLLIAGAVVSAVFLFAKRRGS